MRFSRWNGMSRNPLRRISTRGTIGLPLPVALVAGGHWRAVVTAALAALLSAAVSVVLFGTAVWTDFLASTTDTRSMLESGLGFGHYYKLQSVFAAVRLLGSPMLV